MNYTTEQKMQIKININKIVEYIEKNILPHIDYYYETGTFGPIETWGRCNEHKGQRYFIALNGPYAHKIRFHCGIASYCAEELASHNHDIAVTFLRYWNDAKAYMHTEVSNAADTIKMINNFEV